MSATESTLRTPLPIGSVSVPCLCIEQLLQPEDPAAQALVDGSDVVAGLGRSPKCLPPWYFYDDRGSELFEQICALDAYYLTRTETAILRQHASEIVAITGASELVELGSGSATKVRILLDAAMAAGQSLRYLPIDVSAGILEQSARALLVDYPALTVHGLVGTFELALARLPETKLPGRTICFLGSTLGNLDSVQCKQFFGHVASALTAGEYFLLGVDLHKDTATLEAAYNDRQGVTAEFNLNMLRHLNHRFAGDFDLEAFEHLAYYNTELRQVEIYLVSSKKQRVLLETLALKVEFTAGERLMTEISRKFDIESLGADLARHGLPVVSIWRDPLGYFGLLLCRK